MPLVDEIGALGFASMFALGVLGSGHCLGMCGPLILALPARRDGPGAHLAYHGGRLLTYVVAGLILGGLGGGLARLSSDESLIRTLRVQQAMSVLAALLLGLLGLVRLGLLREPGFLAIADPARLPGFKRLQQMLIRGREGDGPGVGSLFLLGGMLGWLPCGLSFAAFARALAADGPLGGGALTLVFGLGTLPALLLLGFSASRLSALHRQVSDIVAGMLMVGMAVALLADLIAT